MFFLSLFFKQLLVVIEEMGQCKSERLHCIAKQKKCGDLQVSVTNLNSTTTL